MGKFATGKRYTEDEKKKAARMGEGAESFAEIAVLADSLGVSSTALLGWIVHYAPHCPYIQGQAARRIVLETHCAAPDCGEFVDTPPLCREHRRAFWSYWRRQHKVLFRFTTGGNFEWEFVGLSQSNRIPVLLDDVVGMTLTLRYGQSLLLRKAKGPPAVILRDEDSSLFVLEVPSPTVVASWPVAKVMLTRRSATIAPSSDPPY